MTFSKEVIEIFDYIGKKIGIAIDWSSANVVPYLQTLCGKYITWEIATSIVWMIIGVVLLILSFFSKKKALYFYAKMNEHYEEHLEVLTVFSWICVAVGIIFGIGLLIGQTFDVVKCICFPELQIYEYISQLIKMQ